MTKLRACGVTAGTALRWREGIRKSSPSSGGLQEGSPGGPCALELGLREWNFREGLSPRGELKQWRAEALNLLTPSWVHPRHPGEPAPPAALPSAWNPRPSLLPPFLGVQWLRGMRQKSLTGDDSGDRKEGRQPERFTSAWPSKRV